ELCLRALQVGYPFGLRPLADDFFLNVGPRHVEGLHLSQQRRALLREGEDALPAFESNELVLEVLELPLDLGNLFRVETTLRLIEINGEVLAPVFFGDRISHPARHDRVRIPLAVPHDL